MKIEIPRKLVKTLSSVTGANGKPFVGDLDRYLHTRLPAAGRIARISRPTSSLVPRQDEKSWGEDPGLPARGEGAAPQGEDMTDGSSAFRNDPKRLKSP